MKEINRNKLTIPVQKTLDLFDKYSATMTLLKKPSPTRILLAKKDYQRLSISLGKQKIKITEATYRGLPFAQYGVDDDA